jgi:hypothetical protein
MNKLRVLICAFLLSSICGSFAQGSLTPAGPPLPGMRTLLQVEPRLPISHYGTNLSDGGSYYLTTNLISPLTATNIHGITISNDNVTIDLNGFAIVNRVGTDTEAYGITFSNCKNVAIRNGTIRGFYRGISGEGNSGGVIIENMCLATNYSRGISLELLAGFPGGVVRNNLIWGTGGTGFGIIPRSTHGIDVRNASFTVENNTVSHVAGGVGGTGTGIYCASSVDTFLINNRVSRADFGIRMHTPNEYRDNITSNCGTNYVSGIDLGNNN